ncbi:hypothetical protein [Acetobacter okinawensis]|uniref:hypothetical protein n=1 Tax=Acetobacter okinawensis TaxID=1076594 RepID=UPI0039EB8668
MGIPQVADLVLESANAPGTGAFILGGAPDGRQTFADAFPAGGEVYYYASDGTQTEWGIGTLTLGSPNTLARTTVLGNLFGSKNALNFTASITVWSEIPAQRTQSLDDAGMLPVSGNPDFARDVALSAKVADGRYGAIGKVLQLTSTAVQAVTGPVTFSGITMVPTPTDYTQKQPIGASDADARYARLLGGNTWNNGQTFTSATSSQLINLVNTTAFDGTTWLNSPHLTHTVGTVTSHMFAQGSSETSASLAFVLGGRSGQLSNMTLSATGVLATSSGTLAFTSQLPFSDQALRWQVVTVRKTTGGSSSHTFPTAYKAGTTPFVIPVGSQEITGTSYGMPYLARNSDGSLAVSNTGFTVNWETNNGTTSGADAWLTYLVGGYFS